jgi:hypothetical protein
MDRTLGRSRPVVPLTVESATAHLAVGQFDCWGGSGSLLRNRRIEEGDSILWVHVVCGIGSQMVFGCGP